LIFFLALRRQAPGDDQQILFADFEDPDGNPLYLAEIKQGGWNQQSSAV